MSPPGIVVGVQESLIFLVNHILKMATMLKSSTEYNRRATFMEDLCTGRSATKIIRFFKYSRSIIYDVVAKIYGFRTWRIPVCHRGKVTQKNREGLYNHWKSWSADFGWFRPIVAKISIVSDYDKRVNNVSRRIFDTNRTH